MAKKSKAQQAKEMLGASGLDAQFGTPQPAPQKPEPTYRRKTYLLTDELVQRMEAQARANRVGINDFARYVIDSILTMAESGELDVPTRTEQVEEVPGRIVIKTVIDT